MSQPDLAYLDPGDGRRIAYRYRPPTTSDRATLMFLPGYASDMTGTKAVALDTFAGATGCGCLRLDYSGTGESGGAFEDGTLARWLEEVIAAIDLVATGQVLLVGSSMGGWLALLAALRRPERVGALIGIAIAADFTDWGFSAEDKISLLQQGKFERPDPDGGGTFVTHRGFWQSGEALRLLGAPIAVHCPVRLLHGDADAVVPIGVPLKVVAQLASTDVQLTIVKGGGHRLSEAREIDALFRLVTSLLEVSPTT